MNDCRSEFTWRHSIYGDCYHAILCVFLMWRRKLNRVSEWVEFNAPPDTIYRVAQKSKPLPNDQKIVLKPVNEIRFIRQIKVLIKYNNIIRWH